MFAKIADELPRQDGFLFEPKWDGFRALVFRNGEEAYLQSRDPSPLNRYFPELERALAQATPASFVAFDLLAAGGRSTMELPQAERRVRLERLLGQVAPPLHLTPMTRDRAAALDWLQRFEGAGLDGV